MLLARRGAYNSFFQNLRRESARPTGSFRSHTILSMSRDPARPPDAIFLPDGQWQSILRTLRRKKNLIVQGPPGVGKSFVAGRVVRELVGDDATRSAWVQFHPSYAYEDFVQGLRPDEGGGFRLRDGPFHAFARRAADDPDRPHVFVIDEINRANLSKVFGELFSLLETDRRGPAFAMPLTYARSLADTFYLPANLYVLGLMNTADRSLALVDYALRRRFAFVALRPAFDSPAFREQLEQAGASAKLIRHIITAMTRLNAGITADRTTLGPGFEVGHSFFCPRPGETADDAWFLGVVESEVAPLLREYWFDDPDRADAQVRALTLP